MTQAFYLLWALALGFGAATQTAMLGSMGRSRGPAEATWVSIAATVAGLAVLFSVRALRGDDPLLPAPFNQPLIFVGIAAATGVSLALSMRGLDPYLAVTGLFGLAFLLSTGELVPRIGVALYLGASTAGTLMGSVAYDHIGAFGGTVHHVTPLRLGGLLFMMFGVVLVRLD